MKIHTTDEVQEPGMAQAIARAERAASDGPARSPGQQVVGVAGFTPQNTHTRAN